MEFYTIDIEGLKRDLPLCPVNEKLDIGAFVMFSDVELTIHCAEKLLEKCPEFDFILTAEAKGIPLAYEMARQSGKKYFICRKGSKLYMSNPVHVDVRSITTDRIQTLWLDGAEGEQMRGKKVLIVDDVISTGESLKAILALAEKYDCEIAGEAAVLAEGDASERTDIIFLQKLPLFFK